ncbi:MAG: hypothetical protein IJ651_07420 [Bacteroidales bacterium]|nr:hypothetical protein [Bacteroidales bacterium]
MKTLLVSAITVSLVLFSCGNNAKKKTTNPAEMEKAVSEKTETATVRTPEPKDVAKQWYEQDFSMTYKQYVAGASMSRTYARKGNIVIGMVEGGGATTLCICTDSTRTQYQVSHAGGTYKKTRERTGFESVDEAVGIS